MKKTLLIVIICSLFIQCNKDIEFEDLKGIWKVNEVLCNDNDPFCKAGGFEGTTFNFTSGTEYERQDKNSNSSKKRDWKMKNKIIKLSGEPTHDILVASINENEMRWILIYRGISSNLKLEKIK